jgi:anti-anti-sigma regulatory factor
MNLTVEQAQGRVPVTILSLQGDLDASNYQQIVARGRELYAAGTRRLLLDMSSTSFMSSSGLVALHSLALLMRGETPPDPEAGWRAIRAVGEEADAGQQANVKLLNPQPQVDRVLERSGLKQFFEVYTSRETALASF